MREFAAEEKSILDSIVGTDCPWTAVDSLPYNGIHIANLVSDGLVEIWHNDRRGHRLKGGPFITLTPFGCEVMNVTLIEYVDILPPQSNQDKTKKSDPYPAGGSCPCWDPIDPQTGASVHDRWPIRMIDCPWFRRVPFPEMLADPRPVPEILEDENGKPIEFFGGHTARIDRRMRRKSQMTSKRR